MRSLLYLVFIVSACSSVQENPQRHLSSIDEIELSHYENFAIDDDGYQSEEDLAEVKQVKEGLFSRWFDKKVGFFHNAENPVAYDLLKGAKKTIDIEIYEMKDPKFRRLLVDSLKRGVRVRIVKDSNTVGDGCDELSEVKNTDKPDCKDEKAYIQKIQELGANYVYFNKKKLCAVEGKSCFQHGKMIIADNKYLLLSTGNFNTSSFCDKESKPSKCNRDYSYVTKNKSVIEFLKGVMDRDITRERWDLKGVISQGSKGVTVSPFSRPRLVSFIRSARKSVILQNQYLEDPEINTALVEKARAGVDVKIMVSDFCNFGKPRATKVTKSKQIYSEFDASGVKTKIFTPQMKVSGEPGYLHAKAIVVDERLAWVGSINGSTSSTLKNREFGIIFKGRKSVKKLLKIMKEDFNHPQSLTWERSLACEKPSILSDEEGSDFEEN